MEATGLYRVNLDRHIVWDTYLDSFPEGTNLIYKERREYDCNCCKQFIRDIGRIVTIKNGKMTSIWDIQVGGIFQPVVDALSKLVHGANIGDKYLHFTNKVGFQNSVGENGKIWNHLYGVVPSSAVFKMDGIPTELNKHRTNQQTLKRSLSELTLDAGDTVLELIAQGSLYRGDQFKPIVNDFITLKKKYDKADDKDLFCWNASSSTSVNNIRGTAIGTLLIDLSEDMAMEDAVKRYESVVAPANYKRPTALVTKGMIEQAQKKVEELGLQDSLARRYAVTEDLTINNVLFADRSAKASMNVFDDLKASIPQNNKSFDKVEEIGIDDFINNVLPKVSSMEMFVENRHSNNLVSLLAPQDKTAPALFSWNNGFSWSYNGEVTDSIKERVKTAGGRVEGDLRISLSWHNADDLDLHITEPKNSHLYYGHKRSKVSDAFLDLDMNGMDKHDENNPVENVVWADERKMQPGKYCVEVHQFSKRNHDRVGFTVEMEYKGKVYTFNHPQDLRSSNSVTVLEFNYSKEKGVEILSSIGHTKQSKEIWGINTENFQKVSMVLNSPNHWDGNQTGQKHYMFMLEGCANPNQTRGFYNEYLKQELNPYRKVFEVLSSKMKVEHSDNQLSGLGFSSTQRNNVLVKVTGNFTRTLKIVF